MYNRGVLAPLPDLRPVFAARAALTVLRPERPAPHTEALCDLLDAAVACARVCLWTPTTMLQLQESVPYGKALQFPLTFERLSTLAVDSELWWAPDEFPFAADPTTLLSKEPFLLQGLLLVRLQADTPRSPHLLSGPGLYIGAIVRGTLGLAYWWALRATVAATIQPTASALRGQGVDLGVLGAMGYWTAVGLASRALGEVGVYEINGTQGPGWMCCVPAELTPKASGTVQ